MIEPNLSLNYINKWWGLMGLLGVVTINGKSAMFLYDLCLDFDIEPMSQTKQVNNLPTLSFM